MTDKKHKQKSEKNYYRQDTEQREAQAPTSERAKCPDTQADSGCMLPLESIFPEFQTTGRRRSDRNC